MRYNEERERRRREQRDRQADKRPTIRLNRSDVESRLLNGALSQDDRDFIRASIASIGKGWVIVFLSDRLRALVPAIATAENPPKGVLYA